MPAIAEVTARPARNLGSTTMPADRRTSRPGAELGARSRASSRTRRPAVSPQPRSRSLPGTSMPIITWATSPASASTEPIHSVRVSHHQGE